MWGRKTKYTKEIVMSKNKTSGDFCGGLSQDIARLNTERCQYERESCRTSHLSNAEAFRKSPDPTGLRGLSFGSKPTDSTLQVTEETNNVDTK